MTGLSAYRHIRAAIGLIAAYAIALQAVFTTLAPMPAYAGGGSDPFAVHCFGNGNAGLSETGEPGAPGPVSGKVHCVFCGACGGGFVLPVVAADLHPQTVAPLALIRPSDIVLPVAGSARDGPARAPPPAV